MKLVLLGPPGAGKGTQAEILKDKYNIPTISTGMLLRNAISDDTLLGKMAQKYIENGELVPDELVISLLNDRLAEEDCTNGYILDGFPRTFEQAKKLKEIASINKVLSIEVKDQEIIERLSGRRVCNTCGASYHMQYKPSRVDMVCDNCSSELIIREDDKLETIKKRLEIYHKQTEPIKEFYQNDGKLCIAYGQEEVSDTTKEVLVALGLE